MCKNNHVHSFPFLIKSTMALSLATIGFASLSTFDNHLPGIAQATHSTAHAASLPNLNSVYYDETIERFVARDGSWKNISGNSYVSVLINHQTADGAFTAATQVVMLLNPSSAPSNASFTMKSGSTTIMSGAIQSVKLDGKTYYAAFMPVNAVQAGIQAKAQSGLNSLVNFSNVPDVTTAAIVIRAYSDPVSVQLPDITLTENGQNASAALLGKNIDIKDATGKVLGNLQLKKEWLNVTNDNHQAGTYTYNLNQTGLQAIRDLLNQLPSTQLTTDYPLQTIANANVTITAKPVQNAGLTVSYIDEHGKVVAKDQSITGPIGTTGTYRVKLPAGYQLATGQSNQLSYRITQDDRDNLIVKIVKINDDNGSSSASTDSSGSGSADHSSSSSASSTSSSETSSKASSTSSSQSASASSDAVKYHSSHGSSTVSKSTATVVLIDDTTGKTLQTKLYHGKVGTLVPINLTQQILDFLRNGYNLITSLSQTEQLRFQSTPVVYQIHLQKSDPVAFQDQIKATNQAVYEQAHPNATPSAAPARSHRQPASAVEQMTHQTKLHQSLVQDKSKSKSGSPLSKLGPLTPAVMDRSLEAFLQPDGSGGGNGHSDDPDLAAFFTALIGTVNFGQINED
jgi:hypothetical protein